MALYIGDMCVRACLRASVVSNSLRPQETYWPLKVMWPGFYSLKLIPLKTVSAWVNQRNYLRNLKIHNVTKDTCWSRINLLVKLVKLLSHVQLCDPMDCSLPGSSIHGIFQARTLEWVAISFYRGSSQPRDWTRISHIVGRCFYCLSHTS